MIKQAVREAIIILITATVLALVVYAFRPDKIGQPAPSPPTATASPATPHDDRGMAEPEMPEPISLERARQLFDDAAALFADARHPVDYAAGHISGARNLFVDDQEQWLPDLLATTDSARVIVTYCDGERCHLAPELAELLYFNGFEKVYYLKNGWTRWREAGLPIASSVD